MPVKVKEIVKRLEAEGFERTRTTGSPRIYRHPDGRRTVVPGTPSTTLPAGTLASIRRATGLEDLR